MDNIISFDNFIINEKKYYINNLKNEINTKQFNKKLLSKYDKEFKFFFKTFDEFKNYIITI